MNEANHISEALKKAAGNQVAQFNKSKLFNVQDGEDIWFLVSLENERQTGEKFSAFLEMMLNHKRNKPYITKIKIIISDSLNQHYVGSEKAKEMGKNWYSANKKTIEEFEKLSEIKIELVWWNDLFKMNGTVKRKDDLETLYKTNLEYQIAINGVASNHASKAGLQNAINYNLEECAVISGLKGHLCYPSANLNGSLEISVAHFGAGLVYHGYSIYDRNIKRENKQKRKNKIAQSGVNFGNSPLFVIPLQSMPEPPIKLGNVDDSDDKILLLASMNFSSTLQHFGIFGSQQQTAFFQQFLEFKENFFSGANTMSCSSEQSPQIVNNSATDITLKTL